jgi:hypothetical protein
MTVARLPAARWGGGHGLAVGLARWDIRSQIHRGRQFVDIARALVVRELPGPVVRRLRRVRHPTAIATTG